MHAVDITALALLLVLFFTMMGTGFYMLTGKGARLLTAFQAIPKERKNLYDQAAVSRFGGKVIIATAFGLLLLPVGQLFPQLFPVMLLLFIIEVMGLAIWSTGRIVSTRYKKKIENT